MHRTLIAPALLLAAGIALTGCSGGGDDAKPATNEEAETTQAATPAERDQQADLDAAIQRTEGNGYTCLEQTEGRMSTTCTGSDGGAIVTIVAAENPRQDAVKRVQSVEGDADFYLDEDNGVAYFWAIEEGKPDPTDAWE